MNPSHRVVDTGGIRWVVDELRRPVSYIGTDNVETPVSKGGNLLLAGQPTVIYAGDSKTAFGGGTSVATPVQPLAGSYDSKGFWNHANFLLGHPLRVLGNAGIGGQKSGELRARFVTDVIAYAPDWVWGLIGTNDTSDSDTGNSSGTAENIIAMWDAATAAGIKVAWLTIPPIGSGNSGYAAKNLHHMAVNWQLKVAAATRPNVLLIPFEQATLDPATTFLPLPGMLSDNVHETPAGAAREGALIASYLRGKFGGENPYLAQSNGETTNLLASGMLPGSGSAGVISYVARSGRPAWCQMAIPNGTTAAQGLTANASVGANMAIGDKVFGVIEFECDSLDAAAAPNTQGASLKVQCYNGSSFFAAVADLYWDTTYANFQIGQSGVLQTQDLVIPATTTIVQLFIAFYGGGNYRVSRAALRNKTKLGIA